MLKTLTFVLLLNAADGSQTELMRQPALSFAACDAMQKAIWHAAESFPVVMQTADGDVSNLDAACLPETGGQ